MVPILSYPIPEDLLFIKPGEESINLSQSYGEEISPLLGKDCDT